MSEINSLASLVTNTSQSTLTSAIETVRAFKLDMAMNPYEDGFNKGIDAAITALQLFQKAMKESSGSLND